MSQNRIKIYTDGACSGNPGPGGWGTLLLYNDDRQELSGYEPETTNNRMEMQAAIQGLLAIPDLMTNLASKEVSLEIYTDSLYLKDGLNSWLPNWKKRGWRKADGKPVKNQDLWQQLDTLNSQYKIQWFWVKGHSGDVHNERVDTLAREAIIFKVIAKNVSI